MKTAVILDYPENMEYNKKSRKENLMAKNKKVHDIRHKINSGKYKITGKLDVVVDRLLEEILK